MRADAWSEEEDAGPMTTGPPRTLPKPPRPQPPPPPQPALQPAPPATGPYSLQALCLGVLAEYLEELLEMEAAGEGALSLLPPQAKGPLLAAARARCLLTDAALLALADHYGEVLCLRGCGGLSGAAIQQALLRMPHLQQVDVRGCDVGARQLRTLGQACSRVSLLRLGGPATDRAPGVAAALRGVLPGLGGRDAPPADSWEALAGDAPSDGRGGDVGPAGRLMGLQCIVWDGMPYALAQRLAVSCPAVVLNPSALDAAQHGWPPEFAPDWELDAALLQGVAHSERWCAQQGGGRTEEEQPVVHIAERFRLAYISRARRVRAVMERNDKLRWRREERQRGAAERMIRQWELEL